MRRMLSLLVLSVLILAAQTRPASVEDRLWHYRNIGKAFYENPTTQIQAVDEFKKALDLAPNSKREQLNYALAVLRAGRTKDATALLEKIQAEAPELPHTYFNLGIVYKKNGEFAKATPEFEKMVQLAPDEPISHYNLGVLYRQDGRLDEAIQQFQTAAKLSHTLAAPHFQLYNIYRTTDRKEDAARELQIFQQLKKAQSESGSSEDVEWCEYAEIWDPMDAKAGAGPAVTVKYEPHNFARPAAGWVILDFDGDGKPDLLTWATGSIAVWRHGIEPVAKSGLEGITNVVSVAAGDFDNDGLMDLCVITEGEAQLYRNVRGRFERVAVDVPKGVYKAAVWMDYDHDYDLDLFLLGEKPVLMRNQGTAGFADRTADFPFVKGQAIDGVPFRLVPDTKGFDLVVTYEDREAVLYRDLLGAKYRVESYPLAAKTTRLAVEDTNHDGKLEVVHDQPGYVDFDGDGLNDRVTRAGVELNRSTPKRNWVTVQLSGVKNLKLGQGSEVEVKAGPWYQKKVYNGYPLTFEMRDYPEADTVRITWPAGLIQNEAHQPVNKLYNYKEAQRLSGSCPMIWTWNGREFQFITDVLGVAPLGAMSGDGSYFAVDHDEYLQVPGEALALRDGKYEIRMTEELAEVSYIDQLHVYAVDHPADQEIFLNEKWKSPPYPDFRFYGVSRRIYPDRAVSAPAGAQRGENVLAKITAKDRVYPDNFTRNELGSAELHTLDLDFGKAAPDNRAVLVMSGWLDWADGSTFLAASQESKQGLIPPYLQVKNAKGEWQTVIEDMGMPDGKPKTIAVDLTGKFLTENREVRIVTNLCLYWDEIFLSESSAVPDVRQRRLRPVAADVHFRGFSETRIHPERKQPDQFLYGNVTLASFWNPTPGKYTRYGDVRELLEDVDDRMVVMGSGDEISLQLDGASLPALPKGWKRDFMIKVDGWAKDRDANTAFSQSVEPLPFHKMSSYPYPDSEQYPKDIIHKEYVERYNTRPALRLIRPLSGQTSAARTGQ